MPNCHNTVGQHDAKKNVNKQVCAAHRSTRKNEVDKWKMDQGCNNKGQYGFPECTSVVIDPCQLDINHIDGNNDNRAENNIEVLCCMCHRLVTIREEHHKQPTRSRRAKLANTGLFSGLFNDTQNTIQELQFGV